MNVKIPYPGDLNTIETAVWAAEYARARTSDGIARGLKHVTREAVVDVAIARANSAVDDLRHASDRYHSALYAQEKR
jgi:hypothetical protein